MNEVCEQLSNRQETLDFEFAIWMLTTGRMVEPTLAPLTSVLWALMAELFVLIWFQFFLDTQS